MSYVYYCLHCDTRDVAVTINEYLPSCDVCNDVLEKIELCPCGSDADEVDGELCLPCLADAIKSGEQSIEMMTERLSKRVLEFLRKTPEPRVPQLRIRQAS
jgi:hypothetical protein